MAMNIFDVSKVRFFSTPFQLYRFLGFDAVGEGLLQFQYASLSKAQNSNQGGGCEKSLLCQAR
jgi:hypothetical protein